MTRLIGAALVALAVTGVAAGPAAADTKWLCRPGLANNPCTPSLSTTLFQGWDKQVGVIRPVRASHPKADCFYVYPTVSDQDGPNAKRTAEPAVKSIALYQASRYSQYCRVYAPLYRQTTVPALLNNKATPAAARIAYSDVLAAWRDYLAHFNHGRPVVLFGHSQGSAMLERLVRDEIDRNRAVRSRMLSAILLGGNVTVKRGKDVGGTFRNIRACHRAGQLHCVIAFSTYNDTPPTNALFGRTSVNRRLTAGPTGPGYRVLCTNPARLAGGTAQLDSIVPTAPFGGTLIAAGIKVLGLDYPSASTTYIESRGAFSGGCVRQNGATVLRIQSLGNTPVPKPSPDATWGLHLVDGSIALGDLVRVVKAEIAAYPRAR